MPIAVVNQMRPHTGFLYFGLQTGEENAGTHLPLDEEYWLALRHPAEAQNAGYELLAKNRPGFNQLVDADKASLWKEFRAYVRQAEGFYRGAAVLPWKSSPLNYYYSFLNLTKAAAIARGFFPPLAQIEQRVLQHGISARVVADPAGGRDRWSLKVRQPTDAFGVLYALSLGTSIAEGVELEAHDLLGYVPSIQWQLIKSQYPPGPWTVCHWVVMTNQPNNQAWDMMLVPRDFPIDHMPQAFQAAYRELSPMVAKPFAWNALRLHAVQADRFRFLESVNTLPQNGPPGAFEEQLRKLAPYIVQENLHAADFQIVLSLPYQMAGGHLPMSESAATYAVMYFLSSLVRYHPDYMDRIGESGDSWLIESFAKSAPLYLLRGLTREVLGYPLKLASS